MIVHIVLLITNHPEIVVDVCLNLTREMRMKDLCLGILGVVACLVPVSHGFVCDESAQVCETSLIIDYFVTMTHHEHKKVQAIDGKLYQMDVTNITSAQPIPIEEVITADGESPRLVIVANASLPGPSIIVYEGQTVMVHVINKMLSETVTVHWHGLYQRGTPYSDGTGFITQCPIQPLQTFTYKFTADPVGTHWYHSHVGFQRTNGLFGAFIVRKRGVDATNDRVLQIQDWNHNWLSERDYLNDVYKLEVQRYAIDGEVFPPILATAGLINGKGRYYRSPGQHNGAPLEVFTTEENETFRFRIINTGANFPFRVSIDNHEMTVVASDGRDLQPVKAESVVVFPGERHDVTITTDKKIGNYWIRGETLEENPHVVEAILHYKCAAFGTPKSDRKNCTKDSKCKVVNCMFKAYPENYNIQCVNFDQLKSAAGSTPAPAYSVGNFEEHFLNFGVPGDSVHSINGREFQFPNVNVLSESSSITTGCEHADCGDQKTCTCTHTLNLKGNDTVQLVMTNLGTGSHGGHPIHMHGHSFHVVKVFSPELNKTTGHYPLPDKQTDDIDCRGGVSKAQSFCTNATWSNSSWSNGNVPGIEITNAPMKDTINIPAGGYVVVRIKADNPGFWFMHCHIEIHGAIGMAMIINESFPEIPSVPPGFPTCKDYSLDLPVKRIHKRSVSGAANQEVQINQNKNIDTEETITMTKFFIVTISLALVVLFQASVIALLFIRRSKNHGKYVDGADRNEYRPK